MRGELNLPASRGRILKESEVTDFFDVLDWNRATSERTYIKFNYPPSTYLVIGQYKNVQPNSIVRSCALVSGSLTKEDAAAVFLEGLPDYEPHPLWWPNMYSPSWVADHPELGFRKRLSFRRDDSIVLQVGMYAKALTSPSEAKQ